MKIHTIISLILFFPIFTVNSQVTSDFESDIEGWYSEGDGDYLWEIGTGNPGNNFRVNDDATGDINLSYAPVKFLGNWSNATTSDYISADIFLHQNSGSYIENNFVFQIEGPGGKAQALLGTNPPLDTWQNYSVTIDPANWTMVDGDWNSLIQQVNEVVVRMEYINGGEWNRLDNVYLSFSPVIIPVTPVICSDFEQGDYDGWSFANIGGVSNQSSGGNPGRVIRITDGSGISLAYPPPKFLGDWNQIDMHGADLRMDIKVTNYSGSTLISDNFLKISGPGGVATFPMDLSIEVAFDQWKTFVFPVDESYWTMESGTWNDLIDNVNHIEITVEFLDASEYVWLDNFCISDLPPLSDFVASNLIQFIGVPVQFSDLSVYGPTNWDWDFGDGQNATDQHPEHTYYSSGIFDVSLTAQNYFGSDMETKNAYIEILPNDQCLKYEDFFDDSSISPVWWIKNGTWSEASGNIRQTSNYYVTGNRLEGCFAIAGSPFWEDYILTCDLYSTDNDDIGLVFNWQDELNMYMFVWNTQTPGRNLIKWEDGISTFLATDEVPYVLNQWYTIEIESIGGSIVLRVDGNEIFNVNDNTFNTGRAGLFCSGNQSSYWDNFDVSCAGTPVDLKVFLEGPYNTSTGQMETNLNSQGYIPLDQPYNPSLPYYNESDPVWLYNGTENVPAIPANVVDWLYVQFRDADAPGNATSATIIDEQVAFLLANGSVVGLNGTDNIRLQATPVQNLYAVVFHRNHLGVISANALTESGGVINYDFSTDAAQAYGGINGHKELETGVWGMVAGDGNGNGLIQNTDETSVWKVDLGQSGYKGGDFSMNGLVQNTDETNYWKVNLGAGGQTPSKANQTAYQSQVPK
ncbi:MAG TPA: PKD domain-containing protein [Bacteroidales bacterium]|nr:PKD domain-containing protein [Bacteroidales bacterium]